MKRLKIKVSNSSSKNKSFFYREINLPIELEDTWFIKILNKVMLDLADMEELGKILRKQKKLQGAEITNIEIGLKEFINILFDMYYRATCYEPKYGESVSIDELVQYSIKSDLNAFISKTLLSIDKTNMKAREYKAKYDVYQKKLDNFGYQFGTKTANKKISIFKSKYERANSLKIDIDTCVKEIEYLQGIEYIRGLESFKKLKFDFDSKKKLVEEIQKLAELEKELTELITKNDKVKENKGRIPKEGMEDLIFIFDGLGTDIANFFTGRYDLITKEKMKRIVDKTTKFFMEKKGCSEFQSYARVYLVFGPYLVSNKGLEVSERLFYKIKNYENAVEAYFNVMCNDIIESKEYFGKENNEENEKETKEEFLIRALDETTDEAEDVRKEKWVRLNKDREIYEKYMKINKDEYRVEIM